MRIVVAMSGGVDSSVAAALLHEQGHDVVGLSMQLYPGDESATGHEHVGGCCTLDDLHDARRVATERGFPHYIVNLEERFRDSVVSNFVREYTLGRTPLPCAHCNSDLKFSTLLDRARGFGADGLATGHYARVDRDPGGRWRLRRGLDAEKDQSYFLFSLTQAQLEQAMFPVGALTKSTVRDEARRLGLDVAEKRDSQEICFIPDHDYASFVARHAPGGVKGGAIVDQSGHTLGAHDGVHRFTIGQRKGLRLSTSEPLYVLHLDAEQATVTVGPRAALERRRLRVSQTNWVGIEPPLDWTAAAVQIRHRHTPAPARVRAAADCAEVEFDLPQAAVTPGQAAVFYEGDVVLGGGWID